MRLPFLSLFSRTSPFDQLEEHARKVSDCAAAFQEAFECHISDRCLSLEERRQEVQRLEHEADAIKRRIRGHLPKGTLLPVDKFQLFRYLREQDKVLDAVQHTLDWISYRPEPGIPEGLEKDFMLLVEAALLPIDELSNMVVEARKYFRSFQESQRIKVKRIIGRVREMENDADSVEDGLKRQIFNTDLDPVSIYHMVRLAELIGEIADHAENAGDMMRAMVAR